MKQLKISFKFKSFHHSNLELITTQILNKIKILGICSTGFASLPLKTQRFTVLRAPHVDKKSREQFEIKLYSKILITSFNFENNLEKQKAKLLLNFIKNSSAGSTLKITYIV